MLIDLCALIIVSKMFLNSKPQSRFSTKRSYSAAWKTLTVSGEAKIGPSGASSAGPPRASGSTSQECFLVASCTRHVLS